MGIVLGREHTNGMIAASSLSAIGSLTIISAFILFPKLRKKPTYESLNYIAISNLLSSICTLMGNPIDGSPACWIEGVGSNIFTLTSLFWTVVLIYIIYCIITGNRFHITYSMHIICWGLPLLVTLLPLINTTYGADGGEGWCWLVPRSNSPPWAVTFWCWASFFFWIWLCVFTGFLMFVMIYFYGQSNTKSTRQVINKIIFKLMFYPPIVIICWSITTVQDINSYTYSTDDTADFAGSYEYYYINDVLPCLQGSLTAIVFWYTMSGIRKKFIHMIRYGKELHDHSSPKNYILTAPRSPNKLSRVAASGSNESNSPLNATQD